MSGPIYQPSGLAREYGDWALNIYTGCPHRCYYCFAPNTLHRTREVFHSHVEPVKNILERVRRQLKKDETLRGQTVHLCFCCDPYPLGYDTTVTREAIQLLKEYGNHVQILTKGDGSRDLDLLDKNDWYGITLDGRASTESGALRYSRIAGLWKARELGIKTWVSFEPVLNVLDFYSELQLVEKLVDKVKIGKLNHWPSDIDWAEFGREVEGLCRDLGLDYTIKSSLRKEMEKNA